MRALFILLLVVMPARSADMATPKEVKGEPGTFIVIPASTTGAVVKWITLDPGLAMFPVALLKDSKTCVVIGNRPGSYRVLAYTGDANGPSEPSITTVVVNGVPVPPAPPVPPGPPVPPVPPVPPDPPAPIPGDGLRVLLLYDTAAVTSLPAKQQDVLFSQTVRDFLNKKCAKDAQTSLPEWRMWDAAIDAGNESKLWQDVLKRPRKGLPWAIISNGKTGYEGPLPANVDDMMTLLQKFAS